MGSAAPGVVTLCNIKVNMVCNGIAIDPNHLPVLMKPSQSVHTKLQLIEQITMIDVPLDDSLNHKFG